MNPAPSASTVAAPETRPADGWRTAVSWSATSAPVALLLTAGIVLGPQGSSLVPAAALPLLSPIVPVALAAFGVLVGLSVVERRAADGRLFAAAMLVAALVMSVVALGLSLGTLGWTAMAPIAPSFWTLGLACGICAATSLTLPTGNSFEPTSIVTRLAEAGTWMPICAGGVLLAAMRAGTLVATLALMAQASAVTLALAGAGWLLLRRAASPTEERVFALSALLLVGGAADALGTSALLAGLIAGVVWRYAGGRSRETIGRDALFVQHPLLVLVLLVAGARTEISWPALGLGLAYGTLRLGAIVAGSVVAARLIAMHPPGAVGRALLRPGVFGVAFALNAASVSGGTPALVLETVVLGTIISEVLALCLLPRSRAV